MRRNFVLCAALTLLCGNAIAETREDPCNSALPGAGATLKLIKVRKAGHTGFQGYFELENTTMESQLAFYGRKEKDGFYFRGGNARVQVKELSGNWDALLLNWGHSLERRDTLTLPPKTKAVVSTSLPNSELANKSLGEFRLLLTTVDGQFCVVSTEFSVRPVRPPVTGYQSK